MCESTPELVLLSECRAQGADGVLQRDAEHGGRGNRDVDRGGLDLYPAIGQGLILLEKTPTAWLLINPTGWQQPWRRSTARILVALILQNIKIPGRRLPLLVPP